MPPRQLLPQASTFASAIRTSSQPQCSKLICIHHQQTRGLRYDTYEDRRRAAREWLQSFGKKYLRPRKGRTNYLALSRFEATQDSTKAAPATEEKLVEEDELDPWEDESAVEQLKEEHNLSDEALFEYTSRHQGITPSILSYALSKNLSHGAIAAAVSKARLGDSSVAAAQQGIAASQLGAIQQGGSRQQEPLYPFPSNRNFKSQPVLSEELREMIYLKVIRDKLSVRTVSSIMGVTMERVGAVVRMKQMERDWVKQGKPLAVPYARAVLDMLPTTPLVSSDTNSASSTSRSQPSHEPINDLPVHPYTTHQTFVSAPESRMFTRLDAARAFSPILKPADDRIPHPELVEIEKFKEQNQPGRRELANFAEEIMEREAQTIRQQANREAKFEKANIKTYKGKRWQFRFEDVSVESVGKTGRARDGVGARYGMPAEDRKRGQIKIPTSV